MWINHGLEEFVPAQNQYGIHHEYLTIDLPCAAHLVNWCSLGVDVPGEGGDKRVDQVVIAIMACDRVSCKASMRWMLMITATTRINSPVAGNVQQTTWCKGVRETSSTRLGWCTGLKISVPRSPGWDLDNVGLRRLIAHSNRPLAIAGGSIHIRNAC